MTNYYILQDFISFIMENIDYVHIKKYIKLNRLFYEIVIEYIIDSSDRKTIVRFDVPNKTISILNEYHSDDLTISNPADFDKWVVELENKYDFRLHHYINEIMVKTIKNNNDLKGLYRNHNISKMFDDEID